MRFSTTIPLLLLCLATVTSVAGYAFWPQIQFYRFTGHFYPIQKVERLHQAIAVTGWTETELRLANGKAVKLIEFQRLPLKCDALAEATKRGIEITPDGGVTGLVRIHHWCGNDPVREHIARVNISEMLIFLGIGERVMNLPAEENGLERDGGTFSQFGWDISEFNEFEFWQEVRQMNREQET